MLESLKRKIREDKEISNAIAGGIAGAITATVVCPLDVLKTRLQVQGKAGAAMYKGVGGELLIRPPVPHPPPPPPPPTPAAAAAAGASSAHVLASARQAAAAAASAAAGGSKSGPAQQYSYEAVAAGGLSKIMREEGMRGLYRGLTPTLVALLPNWAVYFTAYERLKTAIGSRVSPEWSSSAAVHMAAAAGAGAATMLITNPLWVIKTRLQTQNMGIRMGATGNPALYRGTIDAFVRIAREEGVVGLYSGLGPSLLGVMHVVIQFPLYERLKSKFGARHPDDSDTLNMYELILASATSKMVASTATYPHEVVRSRMHIAGTGAFSGFARTCRQILAEDGIPGFYRGCVTNLLRTTPAAAVTFTSFELINRQLKLWAESPPRAAPRPQRAEAESGGVAQRGRWQAQRRQHGEAEDEDGERQGQQGAPEPAAAVAEATQQQQQQQGQAPEAAAPVALFAAASAASAGGMAAAHDPRRLEAHTHSLDSGEQQQRQWQQQRQQREQR